MKREILRHPGARIAGLVLAGVGGIALTSCSGTEQNGPPPVPASTASKEFHPYYAVTGTIANTKNKTNPEVFDGTWAYSGPRPKPEDQKKVIGRVLGEGAVVQVLCHVENQREIDVAGQSPADIVRLVGDKRSDWYLLQGPLPDANGTPRVTADATDAGGWASGAYVQVPDPSTVEPCRHFPS